MRAYRLLSLGLLFLAGCLPEQWLNPSASDPEVLLVPSNPFVAPGPVTTTSAKVSYGPGDKDRAIHVSQIGNQLLTANPEIGMRPKFALYGTPICELFHQHSYMVSITEGLVKKCQTDGQIAALLAHELALMVVEREGMANPRMRTGEVQPPAEVVIGNGVSNHELDSVRLAELARYDKKPAKEKNASPALPDVNVLTRTYLEKAGYDKADLEAVRPLLKEAEGTYVLEKQMKQTGGVTGSGAPAKNIAPTGGGPTKDTPPAPGSINVQLPPALTEDPNQKPAPVPVWQSVAPPAGPAAGKTLP